jgi:iron complex transport system substrate-binding protein
MGNGTIRRGSGMRRRGIFCSLLLLSLLSGGWAAVAEEGISFNDQNGRRIALPQPATRVVTIPKPAASMFVAVDGASSKLVGMHPQSKTALLEGILGRFFPEMKKIATDMVGEGFQPNVEEMLRVNPDITFQWGMSEEMYRPLETAGLTVAALQYDGARDLTGGWLQMMGAAIGKTEKIGRLLEWREGVRREIEHRVAQIPAEERPSVLYFYSYLTQYQVQELFNMVLLGAVNPAREGDFDWRAKTVNAEQILAWDPDIILLNGFEEELSPEDVYRDPVFADVAAVRHRRVYKFPLGGYRWDPESHESPLSWMWLSMVLYPAKFDWPLRAILTEKYQEIYDHAPSEDEIDGILRMPVNGAAANYEKFKRQRASG